MASHFKLTEAEFKEQYCETEDGHMVLHMRKDGACIYLTDDGCSIHSVKPQQCRDFPHKWREEDSFDYCEGIKKIKEAYAQS